MQRDREVKNRLSIDGVIDRHYQAIVRCWGDVNGIHAVLVGAMHEAVDAALASAPAAPDAHEVWAAAQLVPGEGIEDGVARVEALLGAASAPAAEPVGTLTVQRFRGHLENASFDYSGTLADGTYPLYTRPAAQDSNPQAQNAGWSGWACQYPGKLPRLYGAREIAELNFYPEEGDRLFQVREMAPGAVAPGLRFRVHKDPKTGSLYGSLPNVPPSEQEDRKP